MARLIRSPIRLTEEPLHLDLGARAVPLRLRRDGRARRFVLHIDPMGDGAIVTLPMRARASEAIEFAHRHTEWIARRLTRLPPRVRFEDGARVPVLGTEHVVRHRPDARRGAWREDGVIHVSGDAEHLTRRLRDWFKAEARREVIARVGPIAARVERPVGRITIGDPRTLWGSCGRNGHLSFSWRLVMALPAILDYVIAHEVAHLVWRGHGPRFWALVDTLIEDSKTPRAWLRTHGEGLHRYG